jgi:hypothetical protein
VGTFRRSSNGGTFVCDPGLPARAVVTMVQFTLLDDVKTAEIRDCALLRSGLTVATASTAQQLASVPGTGVAAAPGIVRKSDSSIDFATVDNARYAYWLKCEITSDNNQQTGIFGADVIYTVSAVNG